MKFDITGSSAEPIAIDPEHLPDDLHDIDIAAKVPDSWLKVDEKRSPSFRPIADRLADVLIGLRPELKLLPKEARLIAYTQLTIQKKSAFKLTLNTVASSVFPLICFII